MNDTGIYIHIPFCRKKCNYCDFYSVFPSDELKDVYTKKLCETIRSFPEKRCADTVYFGGGTPSVLGDKNLISVLEAVDEKFGICKNAEVTVEVNPGDELSDSLINLKQNGFNRLSVGMQSANDNELKILGRRHSFEDTKKTVDAAVKAGFERYSLDLMLGIPEQTSESLKASEFACRDLGASHVSAYLLKIEDGTVFGRERDKLVLPDEDIICGFYEQACSALESFGLKQYEISNFAVPGEESRHNIKYWRDEEYIGFGPAAHSYFNGKRFYFKRDINSFMNGEAPVYDGEGGDIGEYLMMRLRLAEGVKREDMSLRFGADAFASLVKRAKPFLMPKYVKASDDTVSLTRKGFLVSNYIITRLLP